ncbi:MAG: riboflavin synthase [Acidimicrobiales bacterium]
MFTGIVEETGRLLEASPAPGGGVHLVFEAVIVLEGTRVGDSISVNGCCLTVVSVGDRTWSADAVGETLSRTGLGALRPGDPVNLERAVRLSDRLGGHLVQGHVDAVGRIASAAPELRVEAPESVLRYLVPKGSVTVDGCSLTVVEVSETDFSVAVIPHTAEVTVLGAKRPGDVVNLEADVVAKYVERLVSPYHGPLSATSPAAPTEEAG